MFVRHGHASNMAVMITYKKIRLHLRGEILTSKIITKKNFEVTNIFMEVPEENHQILSFFK